jgi:lipopolysaccharide biosynthesis glycosyltransferase
MANTVPSYIFKTVKDGEWLQGKAPGGDNKSYLSGQLVINNVLWLKDMMYKKLIDFINEHKTLDESPLSILCAGKIKELDKHWCVPANYVTKGYKHPQMLYDYDLDNVKLWHWSGSQKPWENENVRNYDVYKKYQS